jgi:hypothetical protein
MGAFWKCHRLRHPVVHQTVSHRDELKIRPAFRKHYQLRGKLTVCQVVVHRQECAAKRAFRKHYQLRGELVMEFRNPLSRRFTTTRHHPIRVFSPAFKSQNLVEPTPDSGDFKGWTLHGVSSEMAFQKYLIDSHALFSPSSMDSHLKIEPPADPILKGADHEATTKDELGLFCRSFTVNLRCYQRIGCLALL